MHTHYIDIVIYRVWLQVWVVVLSNVIAILLQTLAARLGLVTGKHLAQVQLLTPTNFILDCISALHVPASCCYM